MYRFVGVGLAALLLGFFGGWKTQGWRLGKEIATIQANHDKAIAATALTLRETEQKYREQEVQTVRILADAQEKRDEEIRRINARHATAINSLRNRPERVVHTYSPAKLANPDTEMPSTPAACVGTTGQELARGDAEFLAGYAADAARLEAALNQCEAAYNALRN